MYLLLIYLIIFIFPLAVMPRYIMKGLPPYYAVLRATLWTAALSVVVFMSASMSGQGLFAQIQDMIGSVSKEVAENPMIKDALSTVAADGTDGVELLGNIYTEAFKVLPATIMMTGAVAGYIEYRILTKIISKKWEAKKLPPFREFTFPASVITGIVGMYLVTWILTRAEVFGNDMMYANINSLFDFVFSIQGVSTVLMFCYSKRIPQALGWIIALILWFTVFGKLGLVILGMFDLLFGIKHRLLQNSGQ